MLFAIKIYDKPGTGALRDAHRAAHLDYLKRFERETCFAGPLLTENLMTELGSHRLIDLPDRAAAERHAAEEPYVGGGVQHGNEIHRWSASLPHTWRDCPRQEGNVQYLIQAVDRPDGGSLRESLREKHNAYQTRVSDLFITRGPLLSDDGKRQIGSLMIIDVPDLGAAKTFWANEPFQMGGLFETVEFYGWRFGRVFDRFRDPDR